ncbi:MAG TPA: helix-turn-helix transcriptional regulator [Chryseolinea sp.]
MTVTDNIQSAFLEQIKRKLNPNISFADELAENLNISRDSAYRRIRGETVLSLDEAKILCLRYGVSLDNLISGSGDMVSFHYSVADTKTFSFDKWLKSILRNLETLLPFSEKQVIYFAKDIPVFYYFNSPMLGPFKMFFWMSSVLKSENFKGVKFSPDAVLNELVTIGKKIYKLYTEIPRTEIWSEETLNVTLRQIEFYHECGFFAEADYGIRLCDEYLSLVREIRSWATFGYKEKPEYKFNLYKNDLLIGDNTIFFRMGDKRMTFIPFNTMNILTTSDDAFGEKTEDYLTNLTSKSILISTSGEKERNKFFNSMEDKILQVKNRLK